MRFHSAISWPKIDVGLLDPALPDFAEAVGTGAAGLTRTGSFALLIEIFADLQ